MHGFAAPAAPDRHESAVSSHGGRSSDVMREFDMKPWRRNTPIATRLEPGEETGRRPPTISVFERHHHHPLVPAHEARPIGRRAGACATGRTRTLVRALEATPCRYDFRARGSPRRSRFAVRTPEYSRTPTRDVRRVGGANRCNCCTAACARWSMLPHRVRLRCDLGRSKGDWIHRQRLAGVARGVTQRSADPSLGCLGLCGGPTQRVRLTPPRTIHQRGRGYKERSRFSCRPPARVSLNRHIVVRREASGCIEKFALEPAEVAAPGRRARSHP